MYFQVFSFCWSANEILVFLLAAVVLVPGARFAVPLWFTLAALLGAAVVLLVSFGFVPRGSTSSNSLNVDVSQFLRLPPFVFFWLSCVCLFFCGVTDVVHSVTAADLRCRDVVIELALLLVPFCAGAATATA